MKPIIDAHIHLDLYEKGDRDRILLELSAHQVEALIGVSFHLKSCAANLKLAREVTNLKPALGYHPEQPLPTHKEIDEITQLIVQHQHEIVGIGEVGLPYYTRKKNSELVMKPYLELLEHFIILAAKYNKPVILHSIYEDADLTCDLLEKHHVTKAHFHWFKGSKQTIDRMIHNQYYVSVTPDCLYEQEIQYLIANYPLELIMVETDGPWRFDRKFHNQMTHPKMIHDSVHKIAELKQIPVHYVYQQLFQNTVSFYHLNTCSGK